MGISDGKTSRQEFLPGGIVEQNAAQQKVADGEVIETILYT